MEGSVALPPLRVAVVGAGPSGLYAAEALIRQDVVPVSIDVLDRLPTPYGLVRYGVAPDHLRIKAVEGSLRKVFEDSRVRFLGGIELGVAVSHDDLLACYDAVVWATGAAVDRHLDIPGEDLPGSHPATTFVSWYCGHPDASQPFALDVSSVAVIGIGNVAVDVARVLLRPIADLAVTDVPDPVLAALRGSSVRTVYMIGRRGPEHAKFTTKELKELGGLGDVDVIVDPADLIGADDGGERHVRANLAVLADFASRPVSDAPRRLVLQFWRRPVEVRGSSRVSGLRLVRTGPTPAEVGQVEELPVGIVLRAAGYRSVPLPGVPFDVERGVVSNVAGRVVGGDGTPVPGEYVAGWLKRGPTGVIGTNKSDAHETVRSMLADVAAGVARRVAGEASLLDLLVARGHDVVLYDGWLAIDAAEVALGAASGRPRAKVTDWAELTALGTFRTPAPATGVGTLDDVRRRGATGSAPDL